METSAKSLQGLFDLIAQKKPAVGRLVIVKPEVKKHAGVIGRVTWHGVDQFAPQMKHNKWDIAGSGADIARGTYGYRIRVAPVDGSQPFFLSASKVEIAIHC